MLFWEIYWSSVKAVLPEVAICRQTGDIWGCLGDIFQKIAGDLFLKSGDFQKLSIFGEFPVIFDQKPIFILVKNILTFLYF